MYSCKKINFILFCLSNYKISQSNWEFADVRKFEHGGNALEASPLAIIILNCSSTNMSRVRIGKGWTILVKIVKVETIKSYFDLISFEVSEQIQRRGG